MKNERNLLDVIQKMMKVIPSTEQELLTGLSRYHVSVLHAGSYNIEMWWRQVASLLEDYISMDESIWEPWERNLVMIWSNIEQEQQTVEKSDFSNITIPIPTKATVMKHQICGCGHCRRVFRTAEIKSWKKVTSAPVCPYCNIDCVVSVDMLHMIPQIHDERYS